MADARDHEALAIILIGVSGSGKSTVGKALAPALGATFIEGDDYHPASNIAKMRSGTPLDDVDRWPWLATVGRAIAQHAQGRRPVVAACSALRHAYRAALVAAARRPLVFVHLTIDPASLAARVGARHQHFMPASLLESQLATLEPLRDDEDGTEIRETGTVLQTVEAITRWVRRRATRAHGDDPEAGRERGPVVADRKL